MSFHCCSWYTVMKTNWIELDHLERMKEQEAEMEREIARREVEENVTTVWKEEIKEKEIDETEAAGKWKEKVKRKE